MLLAMSFTSVFVFCNALYASSRQLAHSNIMYCTVSVYSGGPVPHNTVLRGIWSSSHIIHDAFSLPSFSERTYEYSTCSTCNLHSRLVSLNFALCDPFQCGSGANCLYSPVQGFTVLYVLAACQRQYGSATEAMKHADGLAVVGVWLEVDPHALPNPELEAITRNMPRIKVRVLSHPRPTCAPSAPPIPLASGSKWRLMN